MVRRSVYLHELLKWRDEKVIKVITGLRRCGKSTLLLQFQEELINKGTDPSQIISLNFEALENEALLDYHTLYKHIIDQLIPDRMNYIFLDEIQLVNDFQKAVDSLYIRENVDLYITGSNAYLLSGELATLLSGRYIEVNVLPFSFKEFFELNPSEDRDQSFQKYLRFGSMPYIAGISDPAEKADAYLEGIYNTIIVKDIELRQQRLEKDNPNKRKITDLALLKTIAKYLASSIGNPIAVNHILASVNKTGRKISFNTIDDYVEALIEPYLFYKAERFDVIGKQLLKQNYKLYISDLGLRRHLLPRMEYDLGHSLENIVYLELLRKGFAVNNGKVGQTEVDFVVKKGDIYSYYQVTASMLEQTTFDREMAPLKQIRDNYPKSVLTLDRFTEGNYEGIEVMNMIDWLLKE